MVCRLIPIAILFLLASACSPTEFVSPLRTPLPTAALPESTPPPSPLETPTPLPTDTPWPTYPIPTPTPLPTTVPPIHTAVAGQLPRITYDLLFVNRSGLMRWNHATGQIEALVTPEAWYVETGIQFGPVSVSADGQKVAYMHSRPGIHGMPGIAVLDLRTQQTAILIPPQGRYLTRVAISPNGEWVAYILPDLLPEGLAAAGWHKSGLSALLARPPAGGGPSSGMIYALRTDIPEQEIAVGRCGEEPTQTSFSACWDFYWSPDSQAIAWNDARGIWLAELGQTPRLLVANQLLQPNSQLYWLQRWSPTGEYALISMAPAGTDARSSGVMDMRTGRIAEIPDSLESYIPMIDFTWLQDGRLFVVRHQARAGGGPPVGEIWRVDGNASDMLTLEVEFSLGVGPDNYPTTPLQLTDGRLALAILNPSNTNYVERGLYFVDLEDLVAYKVTGLPPARRAIQFPDDVAEMNIIWAPDGSGAIIHHWEYGAVSRILLYAPTDGSPLIDLRPVMDEGNDEACCFVWTR